MYVYCVVRVLLVHLVSNSIKFICRRGFDKIKYFFFFFQSKKLIRQSSAGTKISHIYMNSIIPKSIQIDYGIVRFEYLFVRIVWLSNSPPLKRTCAVLIGIVANALWLWWAACMFYTMYNVHIYAGGHWHVCMYGWDELFVWFVVSCATVLFFVNNLFLINVF